MARRQSLGSNIPLIGRIQRYSTMATIFRKFEDGDYSKSVSGQSMLGSRSGPEDSAVVKATLLPGRSDLPIGTLVSTAGYVPTAQRAVHVPPPVQRDVTVPKTAPDHGFEATTTSRVQIDEPDVTQAAVQDEPTTPVFPGAPVQQVDSESIISDSDWNRLRTVMRGHQDKIAREKETPEYIQRQKEIAAQNAAKKEAEAETKKRQDLARLGKLPKAQVVYLSPDEQSPPPAAPAAERADAGQPPEIQGVEEPLAVEEPETTTNYVEPPLSGDTPQEPSPVPTSDEAARTKPADDSKPVQLSPEASTAPALPSISMPKADVAEPSSKKEPQDRGVRQIQPEYEAPAVDQTQGELESPASDQIQGELETPAVEQFSVDPLPAVDQPVDRREQAANVEFSQPIEKQEIDQKPVHEPESTATPEAAQPSESAPESDIAKPRQAPDAKSVQLEPESVGKQPAQEPISSAMLTGEPTTKEKTGLGQRLLDAARSVFQRKEKPTQIPDSTKSLGADETDSIDSVYRHETEIPSVVDLPESAGHMLSGESPEKIQGEFGPVDVSAPAIVEQTSVRPTQPVVQRTSEQPAIDVSRKEPSEEPASQEPPHVEEKASSEPRDVTSPAGDVEAGSTEESDAVQMASSLEKAVVEKESEPGLDTHLEKSEPIAKIEPTAAEPTVSRDPDVHQPQKKAPESAEALQDPKAISSAVPEPQVDIETGTVEYDVIHREPETISTPPIAEGLVHVDRTERIDPIKSDVTDLEMEPERDGDPADTGEIEEIHSPALTDLDKEDSTLQEQPLQEIWPVQEAKPSPPSEISRKPSAEPAVQESLMDEGDLPTLILQSVVEEDASEENKLHSTLKDVAPGKPTDSSIELLPPRRPRPQIAPVQRSEEPGDSDPSLMRAQQMEEDQVVPDMTDISETPEAIESAVQPIQLHEDEQLSRQTEEVSDKSELGSPVEFQQESPEKPASEAGFVQTEIGALPSDLWDYLGETAPETPAPVSPRPKAPVSLTPATETPAPESPTPKSPVSLTPATETPAPESPTPKAKVSLTPATETPAPVIPTLETPASSPIAPAPRTESVSPATVAPVSTPLQTFTDSPRTDLALDTIQRTETKSETSTPVLDFQTPLQPLGLESALDWIQRQEETVETPAASSTEGDQAEESTQRETDYEDLARKILPIIKRKLSIEWERSRGRF